MLQRAKKIAKYVAFFVAAIIAWRFLKARIWRPSTAALANAAAKRQQQAALLEHTFNMVARRGGGQGGGGNNGFGGGFSRAAL